MVGIGRFFERCQLCEDRSIVCIGDADDAVSAPILQLLVS
jgi:hypothetical protein